MNRVPSSSAITTNIVSNTTTSDSKFNYKNPYPNTTKDGIRERERSRSCSSSVSLSLSLLAAQDEDAKRKRASFVELKKRAMSREVSRNWVFKGSGWSASMNGKGRSVGKSAKGGKLKEGEGGAGGVDSFFGRQKAKAKTLVAETPVKNRVRS